jgi:hypothetical protein
VPVFMRRYGFAVTVFSGVLWNPLWNASTNVSTACALRLADTCPYRSNIRRLDHPPSFCTIRKSTPLAISRVAKLWRVLCGVTSSRPARVQADANPMRIESYGSRRGL